ANAAAIPSASATISAHVGAEAGTLAEGNSRASTSAGYQWATEYDVRLKTKLAPSTSSRGKSAATSGGPAKLESTSGSLRGPVPYRWRAFGAEARRRSNQSRPPIKTTAPPLIPAAGAAYASVSKNRVGIRFWICGEPGSASIVRVNAPSATHPGISRLGM